MEGVGRNELDVGANAVAPRKIAIDSRAYQIVVVVDRGQSAGLLIHEAVAELAAGCEQPLIAQVPPLQEVEPIVLGVGRIIEVAIVGVKERADKGTDRRVRELRRLFSFPSEHEIQK